MSLLQTGGRSNLLPRTTGRIPGHGTCESTWLRAQHTVGAHSRSLPLWLESSGETQELCRELPRIERRFTDTQGTLLSHLEARLLAPSLPSRYWVTPQLFHAAQGVVMVHIHNSPRLTARLTQHTAGQPRNTHCPHSRGALSCEPKDSAV